MDNVGSVFGVGALHREIDWWENPHAADLVHEIARPNNWQNDVGLFRTGALLATDVEHRGPRLCRRPAGSGGGRLQE